LFALVSVLCGSLLGNYMGVWNGVMSPSVRRVPGRPGVTLVQIVDKSGGQYKIVKHIGSARTEAELAVMMEEAREFLNPGQGVSDFGAVDSAAVGHTVAAADPVSEDVAHIRVAITPPG
ncbi:hypothetical protein ACFPLA_03140, partial [Brevibacterium otitidis]